MAKKEVTNNYLVNHAMPALDYLAGKETIAWYSIKRNATRIQRALTDFNESLKSIKEKYSVEGAIPEDKQKEADALYVELLNEKVSVDFHTIPIEHLAKTTNGLDLTKFGSLIGFIVIDDEDEAIKDAEAAEPLKAVE